MFGSLCLTTEELHAFLEDFQGSISVELAPSSGPKSSKLHTFFKHGPVAGDLELKFSQNQLSGKSGKWFQNILLTNTNF